MGMELMNYYVRENLDSLKIAAVDLLLDASEQQHEFARAVGTRMLGIYLSRTGKIKQGLKYLKMALNYFEKKEDFTVVSEIWNAIGHAYSREGSYEVSKEAYENSLRFGEHSNDATAGFNGKLGLGRLYIAMGDTATGMTILHQYKQSSIQSEKYEAAADVYAFMAQVESDKGNNKLSREYYGRSIEFSKRSQSKPHIAHSYTNEGIRKFMDQDYDSSLYYFKKSLDLRIELKAIRPILEAHYNLGSFYDERDSMNLAIQYFEVGRKMAEQHKMWPDLVDFLDALITIYDKRDNLVLKATYLKRLEEVQEIIDNGSGEEDVLPDGINLNFTGKKNKKTKDSKDEGGLNWVVFILIVLALLIVFFLFLERNRFN